MTFRRSWFGLAALAVAGSAFAQSVPAPQEPTPDQKKEIAKKFDAKTGEMEALRDKATAITKSMGELASSGKLPTSADAIELMRKMVEEMSLIRQQLDKVTAEVDGIKTWIAGRKEPQGGANLEKDVANLKKFKPGGYLQVQYRDTNQQGGATDAFAIRRMRFGATIQADAHTSAKVSVDLATGTNQTNAQLKDAFITYDVDPSRQNTDLQFIAGQRPLPLGYDLSRSSSEREFPERSIYSQRMFNGERDRGIMVQYGLGSGTSLHVGGWNALTVNDPEQSSLAPAPESRHAFTAGIRNKGANHDVGISGIVGERPQFVSGSGAGAVTHPRVDREFIYVDGVLTGLFDSKFYVRGEAMWGKDRVPVTGTPATPSGQTDMAGYQLQVGYNFSASNQFHLRLEQFDPDRDTDGNAVRGFGGAWTHFLNPSTKITASHEVFRDNARTTQKSYHVTTLRVQFKY